MSADANFIYQSKSQATIEELQSSLQKREADCLRLRESRDAITAEASVRRARDAERSNAVAQLKVLVDTRGVGRVGLNCAWSDGLRLIGTDRSLVVGNPSVKGRDCGADGKPRPFAICHGT